MAGIKWENYIIGCSMDGKIRVARGKVDKKMGFFVANDKSHDLTGHAVQAVKDHMKTQLREGEEVLTITFEDGSKLIYEKPEKPSEKEEHNL